MQGVWFRGWTLEEARRRGLVGWVRNRLDGSVEALFSGAQEKVEAMIALCHQGPGAASVSSVQRFPAAADELRGTGFVYLPTE